MVVRNKQGVGLNRPLILETALAVIDSDGYECCTMRDVARHLDVTDMALYRYVTNRDELLDGVLELLLSQIDDFAPGDASWDQRLRVLFCSLFDVYRGHPRVLPALLNRPLCLPSIGRGLENSRASLANDGFSEEQATDILAVLAAYTLGYAALLCGGYFGQVRPSAPERTRSRRRTAQSCPGLLSAAEWASAAAGFERGLDVVLEGLRAAHAPSAHGAL